MSCLVRIVWKFNDEVVKDETVVSAHDNISSVFDAGTIKDPLGEDMDFSVQFFFDPALTASSS